MLDVLQFLLFISSPLLAIIIIVVSFAGVFSKKTPVKIISTLVLTSALLVVGFVIFGATIGRIIPA